jgi:hypothetical protein
MGNADDAFRSGRKNMFRPGRTGNDPGSAAMTGRVAQLAQFKFFLEVPRDLIEVVFKEAGRAAIYVFILVLEGRAHGWPVAATPA